MTLLILVAVLVAGAFAFAYRPRQAVLVNGLGRPYTATVDGKTYTLEPFAHQEITVRPGFIEISVTGAGVNIPPISMPLEPTWGSADRRMAVLNPDQCALIEHVTRQYGSAGSVTVSGERRSFIGWTLYSGFWPVDAAFAPLPDSTISDKKMVVLGDIGFAWRYDGTSRRSGNAGRVWLETTGSESRNLVEHRANVLHRIDIEPSFLADLPAEMESIAGVGIEDLLIKAGFSNKDGKWVREAGATAATAPTTAPAR